MTFNGPKGESFARRRTKLVETICRQKAVVFIPGAPEAIYSNDVHYRYRPATNIRYLSGFEEPAALILSTVSQASPRFVLLVQPRDETSETWTGRRAGIEGAIATYGADDAYPLENWTTQLEVELKDAEHLYYGHSVDVRENERLFEVVHRVNAARQRGGGQALELTEVGAVIDDMRQIKHADEIELLRRACAVSAAAHRRAMESLVPGMYEYHVEATIEHEFRAAGCAGPAYGTIAAAGANATILHYTRNTSRLLDGQLLLVDAGAEYGGYCGDITRTLPIGASYTRAQADLYELVLAAQMIAIETVAPGTPQTSVHDAAVRTLTRGMLDLDILEGSEDECIESGAYKKYFMHGTSHWLGMDVHDVGDYHVQKRPRLLEPGFVLTVEPGLYIPEGSACDPRWHGIGVRIEDDVLVTEVGHRVLTDAIPKSLEDLERILAARPASREAAE